MRTIEGVGKWWRSVGPRAAGTIWLVGMACLLTLVACTPRRTREELVEPQAQTKLVVENQGLSDMTIYAMRGGQRIRLGRAPGNRTTALVIPSSIVSGMTLLSFQAEPLGSRRVVVAQQIPVTPGDEVAFYIPSP